MVRVGFPYCRLQQRGEVRTNFGQILRGSQVQQVDVLKLALKTVPILLHMSYWEGHLCQNCSISDLQYF